MSTGPDSKQSSITSAIAPSLRQEIRWRTCATAVFPTPDAGANIVVSWGRGKQTLKKSPYLGCQGRLMADSGLAHWPLPSIQIMGLNNRITPSPPSSTPAVASSPAPAPLLFVSGNTLLSASCDRSRVSLCLGQYATRSMDTDVFCTPQSRPRSAHGGSHLAEKAAGENFGSVIRAMLDGFKERLVAQRRK